MKALDEGKPEGYLGHAYGETVEDVKKHADQAKEDVKEAKALVLLIGWESKEIHMKFRESELFKEQIHLVREKQGGVELVSICPVECYWQEANLSAVPCPV
jgi:heme-degrading monooxygenase HmoA